MPTIALSGRPYHFQDVGKGPPFLLLHAFPLSSSAFQTQIGALPARLILPDHRGFGASGGSGPTAVTMEQYAQDALDLLDYLGIDRAVVGGVSMGGYIAMALLALAPERVAGLALLDTRADADDAAARAAREKLALSVLDEGLDGLIASMLPKLVAPGSHALPQVEALIREAANPEGVAAALRGMALRPERTRELAAYRGPALVLVGELDGVTNPEKAEAMVRLMPQASLVRVPDAGHLANLERPAIVNAALAALVDARWLADSNPGAHYQV